MGNALQEVCVCVCGRVSVYVWGECLYGGSVPFIFIFPPRLLFYALLTLKRKDDVRTT